ncbi:MAG: transglycosylase SLT domain-containing protein [Polyangiaceae bacterium]|nr:transglycosylase SLT domain-containing protein [Polyangiaceae bacterium]
MAPQMVPRVLSRLLVYPIVLFCGMAVGSTFGPTPSATPPTGRFPQRDGQPPAHPDGRLGAESVELRALRAAERHLFPELHGFDPDASLADRWDHGEAIGDVDDGNRRRSSDSSRRTGNFLADLAKPDLPVQRHPRVAKYIKYFSENAEGRKLLTSWLKRSGYYQEIVEDALRAEELPIDLRAVVFIESGCWPTARSTAGALGLWQFMPRTARAYGLVVDGNVDERRSIWRSTEAATLHLRDLHDRFRSWDLALAAYNYGHENVERRMGELAANNYWELADIDGGLPRETALYVPKVLAVAVILRNLEHFGFDDVELAEPLRATAIQVPPGIRLSLIARAAGTSTRTVREMNPEFREDMIPDRGGPSVVRIPTEGLARARTMLPRLVQNDSDSALDLSASYDFDWGRDEFGTDGGMTALERLSRTRSPKARKRQAPLELLNSAPLSPASRAAAEGLEPDDGDAETSDAPSETDLVEAARSGRVTRPRRSRQQGAEVPRALPRSRVVHRVEAGETVWDLAQMYGVSSGHIVRENNLSNPDLITPGRTLVMHVPTVNTKKPAEDSAPAAASAAEPVPAPSTGAPPPTPASETPKAAASEAPTSEPSMTPAPTRPSSKSTRRRQRRR